MSNEAQMKLMNLNKGKTVKKVMQILSIAEIYHAHRVLSLRIKTSGLTIGD